MAKNLQPMNGPVNRSKKAAVPFDEHAVEAVQQAISQSVVGVIGPDDHGRVGQIGTGSLVQIGNRCCILTARHNLDGWALADLRFFLPAAGAQFPTGRPPVNVRIEDLKAWQPLDIDYAFSDEVLDLAVLELSPRTTLGSSCVFREIGALRQDLPIGSVFVMMGFPKARTRRLSENVAAIYSSADCPVVSPPPSTLTLRGYVPSAHLLVTFPSAADYEPHGYSGAGLWGNANKQDGVWSPVPVFVGMVLTYYGDPPLLKALKVDAMERFFEAAFAGR